LDAPAYPPFLSLLAVLAQHCAQGVTLHPVLDLGDYAPAHIEACGQFLVITDGQRAGRGGGAGCLLWSESTTRTTQRPLG
jgi:hypothetical protein